MSVITEDNVEVELVSTVFFRVLDAAKSVYRIRNIDLAIENTAISVIRSAAGKLELDDLQSSREAMNQEIAARLSKAAEVWGVEVTRTEILDVLVDEKTKESQRQQHNAERERRATIAKAEGDKSKAVLHYPELRVAKLKAEIDAAGVRGPTAGLKKIIKTITSDSVMDFFREVANPQEAASVKRERSEKAKSSFNDEFLKDKYKE